MEARPTRKTRTGIVVSNTMQKTIVVNIERTYRHPEYERVVRRSKRYKAHDEKNECQVGDIVEIMETRPLSKTKRWRLIRVIEKAK